MSWYQNSTWSFARCYHDSSSAIFVSTGGPSSFSWSPVFATSKSSSCTKWKRRTSLLTHHHAGCFHSLHRLETRWVSVPSEKNLTDELLNKSILVNTIFAEVRNARVLPPLRSLSESPLQRLCFTRGYVKNLTWGKSLLSLHFVCSCFWLGSWTVLKNRTSNTCEQSNTNAPEMSFGVSHCTDSN